MAQPRCSHPALGIIIIVELYQLIVQLDHVTLLKLSQLQSQSNLSRRKVQPTRGVQIRRLKE